MGRGGPYTVSRMFRCGEASLAAGRVGTDVDTPRFGVGGCNSQAAEQGVI